MKKILTSFTIVASLTMSVVLARAGADVTGSATELTHDCGTDPEVSISSAMSTVTITGSCSSVSVMGANNTISIASSKKVAVMGSSNTLAVIEAGKISLTGTSNVVTYQKGLGKAKAPKISKSGVGNKATKVKPVAE
jgi:hypothetical protein